MYANPPFAVNFNPHNAMFYPNSYLNFNSNGYYTKHYYNGMERIASRLGDQNLQINTNDPELQDRKEWQDSLIRKNIVEITGYEFLPVGEEQDPDDPKPIYELPVIGLNNLQPSADGIFYYHPNHLGSTCYVTDENASVVQGFLYAPFGEITNEYNSSFGNNVLPKYSFNAKELDEETGMYYYEARYYQPPTFTSRDVLFEEKPWLTPYHYCSNNPVVRVDPTGMMDDWYKSEDGKTVIWKEGHASTIVDANGKKYRNIGETYSKKNEDGTYTNYYQNIGLKSIQKFNAKDYILNNGLVGKFISKKSTLSETAKTELFQASIHKGQNAFLRGSIEYTADLCNNLGMALSGAGTVATAVPGGQSVAGILIGSGNAISKIGTIINLSLNILDGNYGQAVVNVTSFAVGKGSDKLWKGLNLTPNQTHFLQGKSDFQNSIMTNIINKEQEKKQKK